MKDYVLKDANQSPSGKDFFLNGLVFGFDVGTGSIGYAVRQGSEFKDVGVLICDSEGSDLSGRRSLRRQRRTLRSKKYRRQWLAKELIKLGLLKPENPPNDPISLRLRALNGDKLTPGELHAALTHLFKRRGYSKVPWANVEKPAKENAKPKKDDKEGEIKKAVESIRKEMDEMKCEFPCQLLDVRRKEIGVSPAKDWARKIYWPRELLQKEFEAITKAQKNNFQKLAEKTDWLLYGDSQPKKKGEETYHVFFKTTEARNPGVLGLRWPRFDNRGPALDSLQPVDEQGRLLHVVRKTKDAFTKAQWELAVMNFRVIDRATGKLVTPDNKSLARLREIWESGKRKKKKDAPSNAEEADTVKISEPVLKRWAKDFAAQYKLVDGQQPLTPQTGAGRARYASPTLKKIIAGERFDPPQPLLRRKNETPEQALNRYLADIKHPLVRHRLVLFQRLLKKLVSQFGKPDMVVLEAVRSLALGKDKKRELIQRIHDNREEREGIRKELSKDGFSSSKNSILRYRLFKEAKGRCPFCLCPFCLQQVVFKEAEIEHIVPRSRVDCNEFYNLTVAHADCNKKKDNRTPWEAFGQTADWEALRKNAEECFGLGSMKYKLFTNPDAQDLVEEKSDLQHTAYIARVIRQAALIQLGWLGEDGRDPTGLKDPQKTAWKFQVTNGQLTSRLRKAWGLNQILHPLPADKKWDDLSEQEQQQFTEKNRGDLRHHALDAMVIACTLPWLAHRTYGATDEFGRHGWWTQDEKHRSRAVNRIFPNEGQMHEVVKSKIETVVVQHHESRSNHQQAYATTVYGKLAPDTYAARERLTDLKQSDFRDVHPKELGVYLDAAWERFREETSGLDVLLKKTNSKLPATFVEKLCFSHFQKWREDEAPAFTWPKTVKIPIRNVKLIAPVNDDSVLRFAPGTPGFVKRKTFKEVHIYLNADKKGFVPVFVPYWKGDKPVGIDQILPGSKPVAVLRKRSIIKTIKPLSTGHPPGNYCLYELGQVQPYLLPPHIAKKEEAIESFGIKKSGIKPRWPDLIRALGYELPHPPPVKP
jgi:5-methylcytosine-specific restriction endonuclease McrA